MNVAALNPEVTQKLKLQLLPAPSGYLASGNLSSWSQPPPAPAGPLDLLARASLQCGQQVGFFTAPGPSCRSPEALLMALHRRNYCSTDRDTSRLGLSSGDRRLGPRPAVGHSKPPFLHLLVTFCLSPCFDVRLFPGPGADPVNAAQRPQGGRGEGVVPGASPLTPLPVTTGGTAD